MTPMNVFFVGAVDGEILKLYRSIREVEEHLGLTCDWVVSTGHFGIWPSAAHMPAVARQKRGGNPGDFTKLMIDGWSAPRPTVFIAGAQDSHKWMNLQAKQNRSLEILPNLTWLRNGNFTLIGNNDVSLRLLGLGKSYSPKTYHGEFTAKRATHYRRSEVNRACSAGRVDVLVTHAAPDGLVLGGRTSTSEGILDIVASTRPNLLVHGGLKISEVHNYLAMNMISLDKGDIRVAQFLSGSQYKILL